MRKYEDINWYNDIIMKAGAWTKQYGRYTKMFIVSSDPQFISPTSQVMINGKPFTAIWDTGSAQSTIGNGVKNEADIGKPIGFSQAYSMATEHVTSLHRVTLTLPDGFEIPNFLIQYSEGFLEGAPHNVVLGMDLISRGRFEVYQNEVGETEFKFSYNELDLLSGDLEWQ